METLVYLIVTLSFMTFLLKLSFNRLPVILGTGLLVCAFLAVAWHYAIEQTQVSISVWLKDEKWMLNLALVMSIDIGMYMMFLFMKFRVRDNKKIYVRIFEKILEFYPGIFVFVALFGILTWVILNTPGVSFSLISGIMAAAALLLSVALAYFFKKLIGEEDLRGELLFLSLILLICLMVIATVNGRVAVASINSFDLRSLLVMSALVLSGFIGGYGLYKLLGKYKKNIL